MIPACSEIGKQQELLLEYCSGKLEGKQVAALESHFTSCPECAGVRDAQLRVWEALDQWDTPAISSDFNRRLYARIDCAEALPWYHKVASRMHTWMFRPAVPLGVAAALLLLTGLLYKPSLAPVVAPVKQAVDLKFSEGEAEQMERTLDDLEMLRQFDIHPEEPEKLSDSM